MENNGRGYPEVCSDCEAYGLKKHGLTRSDYTYCNRGDCSASSKHQNDKTLCFEFYRNDLNATPYLLEHTRGL